MSHIYMKIFKMILMCRKCVERHTVGQGFSSLVEHLRSTRGTTLNPQYCNHDHSKYQISQFILFCLFFETEPIDIVLTVLELTEIQLPQLSEC